MKSTLHTLGIVLLFCVVRTTHGQCPSSLTINVQSVSAAACPDNGTVTLGGSGVGNPSVVFSIVSGPSRVGTQQASPIFNSLGAGLYVFRATCSGQTAEITSTVANTYTSLNPAFSANVSNTCDNFTPGGTISVAGVSGGRAPLEYSFIQSNAANYSDALSVYGSTGTFNAPAWGAYQVRVKDACGIFLTKTVNIQRIFEPVTLGGGDIYFENMPCDSALISFWLSDDNFQGVSLASYPNLKFRLFEKLAGTCSPGALIKSFTLSAGSGTNFIVPRRDVYVETTTPCGDTRTMCYDYPDNDSMRTVWQPVMKGCGTGPDPYTLTLQHRINYYTKLPALAKIFNHSTNTLIQTAVVNGNWQCCAFSNLPPDTYRIETTDACGNADTVILYPPSGPLGILPEGMGTVIDKECSFENGKTTVKLRITGLSANVDVASITITSGPDNIGQSATINGSTGLFKFYNLTPGATYGFLLDNTCSSVPLGFTVPANGWNAVNFSMLPVVSQQCGGAGTINAGVQYDGWGSYHTSLWQGGIKIDENNSGIFTNLAPGLYTIKGIAEQVWCTGATYKELSDTVRVYNDATPPQLLRQFGFVCETGGIPGALGKASVEIAGFGPFSYALKQVSPSPESAYTAVASNAPGVYTFNNLVANAVYSLLITDNCGKSTVSELVVGNIGNLSFTNPYEPCAGAPFLLSADDIAGASYTWVKKDDPLILSTTKDLYFPSYNAVYNAQYECTIKMGDGCLQRTISASLNSNNCGALLPVKLSSFSAVTHYCKTTLAWTTTGFGEGIFQVERSSDGNAFVKIGEIGYNNQHTQNYFFKDEMPREGHNYYRLKVMSLDGMQGLSKPLLAANNCTSKNIRLNLYPNPVINNHAVLTIYADHAEIADLQLLGSNGRLLRQMKAAVRRGEGIYTLDMTGLPAGYYFIKVNTPSGYAQSLKLLRQ
jgi:hypothetical protein